MSKKVIIEMSYMEQMVASDCIGVLSGQSIIVLYNDLTMSIKLFKALTANKITADFKQIDISSSNKSQAFKFGFLLGSLRQDVLLIGKVPDFVVADGDYSITVCDDIKSVSKLLASDPVGKSAKRKSVSEKTLPLSSSITDSSLETKKRGRRKKSVDPVSQDTPKEMPEADATSKPKRSEGKSKGEAAPTPFTAKLREIGINKVTKDFPDTSTKIYKAICDSMTDITLDMQLRINLLDADLYGKVYPIIREHYQELKELTQ